MALEAQRGSEARAVVEAPALLDLGGTRALRSAVGHRRAPVVPGGRLAVLDALTSGARHPDPLLKAQLLAEDRGEFGEKSDSVSVMRFVSFL